VPARTDWTIFLIAPSIVLLDVGMAHVADVAHRGGQVVGRHEDVDVAHLEDLVEIAHAD
jgi:hypothetical protein